MLKTFTHSDVICGHGIINAFGAKMNIYLYFIDGLLVDTGPRKLKESIGFFNTYDINQVALTHVHEDHTGMAAWLEKNKNPIIYLHNKSINYANIKAKLPLYRTLTWGKRLPFNPVSYPDKINTDKYTFEVIPTPGHAHDHISLIEKNEGWLFTGDMFLGTRQLVCIKEENIPQTITSLQKLLEYDFNTIFCAHSGIHNDNPKEKLKKRLEYFLDLKDKTLDLYNKGLSTKQIDKKLFPKKPPITFVSSGEWSSYNIINSIINDK